MKILVIDDNRVIIKMIQMILLDMGYDVTVALDGIEGMRLFGENDFDLVITDLCMPGIDGNEVAHRIRVSSRPYTPVIGISGNILLFEISRFDAVIQKPFMIKTLVDTILNLSVREFACRMDAAGYRDTFRQEPV